MELPTGTITFLLTDIEGSTRLWEAFPEAMTAALARHDALAASIITRHRGILVKSRGEGDSLFAVFADAAHAVAAACTLQRAFRDEPWSDSIELPVRIALHTGDVQLRDQDYYGPVVNRSARLRAIGHGGQVLVSQATASLVREMLPEGGGLRDLGAHRLKDLQRPERVYQLLHAALPTDFPPLRSLQTGAHNLPAQLTSFIGREREVADLKRLLETTRLVTVAGSGGCGKTRLTLQVAAEIVDTYPDGIWLVELAALQDPALVAQTIRTTLQLREEPQRSPLDTAIDYLRSRTLVLLLDNCEHLLDVCAAVVKQLLLSCPYIKIVATSREPIDVPGEFLWRVPSLALPNPSDTSVAQVASYEAVRLFLDRAASNNPSFELSNANSTAITEICRRLDGIPLALELAAARTKALTVQQIAERLHDRFRLLTGGSRTGIPRHQTLQAAIDWSYDLLTPEERLVLCRLSVFAGSWTLEAAEVVCADEEGKREEGIDRHSGIGRLRSGIDLTSSTQHPTPIEDWQVLDQVCQLVDKSLVMTEAEEGSEQRYRLLESVRQYALTQLSRSIDAAGPQLRHRRIYTQLALDAQAGLTGPDQPRWLRRLESDLDNLRAAMDDCRSAGDAEDGLRLALGLSRFWLIRGYYREGRDRLTDFLANMPLDPVLVGQALHAAARLTADLGDIAPSIAWARRSLDLAQAVGDRALEALALILLGYNGMHGDPEQALLLLDRALAAAQASGDAWLITEALATLGFCRMFHGDADAALTALSDAMTRARIVGDPMLIGELHFTLGLLAIQKGDDLGATQRFAASLETWESIGHERGIAMARDSLARMLLSGGQPEEARPHLKESLRQRTRQSNEFGIASALEGCASLAVSERHDSLAARLLGFTESLRNARNFRRLPAFEVGYRHDSLELETRLGAASFAQLLEAGHALTLEQAIAEAMSLFA